MEKNLKKDCQSVQKRQREGKREGKARQLQNVLCYTQTHTHTHTHTHIHTHTHTHTNRNSSCKDFCVTRERKENAFLRKMRLRNYT